MDDGEIQAVLDVLNRGEITLKGEFMWGSNYTFLVEVCLGAKTVPGVYKPTRGERPLWDFPAASLARREAAAFLVSEALAWRMVPPTVYRRKGPIGAGSLQLYIDHNPEMHYFNFDDTERQRLRPVVLFDLLINNADRKGSHVLLDAGQHIWLIDHGICFHVEEKLRTVIWDFAGEPFPENLCADLQAFQEKLAPGMEFHESLREHLTAGEVRALAKRLERLLAVRRFPDPHPDRRPYPWPPI
jgi:uncharacterized repeat protein (TIGR03843 family)